MPGFPFPYLALTRSQIFKLPLTLLSLKGFAHGTRWFGDSLSFPGALSRLPSRMQWIRRAKDTSHQRRNSKPRRKPPADCRIFPVSMGVVRKLLCFEIFDMKGMAIWSYVPRMLCDGPRATETCMLFCKDGVPQNKEFLTSATSKSFIALILFSIILRLGSTGAPQFPPFLDLRNEFLWNPSSKKRNPIVSAVICSQGAFLASGRGDVPKTLGNPEPPGGSRPASKFPTRPNARGARGQGPWGGAGSLAGQTAGCLGPPESLLPILFWGRVPY